MKQTVVMMVSALVLVATAEIAVAQVSFGDLQTVLKAGDEVSIEDEAGGRTRGTVTTIGTSLRIAVGSNEREFAPQQVREIRRRGDSLKNGVMIGLLAGGAAGAVIGSAVGTVYGSAGHDPAAGFIPVVAIGLGAGAAIGAGLDAAVTGSSVVYRSPKRAVTVAPLISPRGQGVRVGLAF